MATFLQLAQRTAKKSRTVGNGQPTTVLNQVGRLGDVVNCVSEAWTLIQNQRNGWRFMVRELGGGAGVTLLAGTSAFTPAALGITDHAAWDPASLMTLRIASDSSEPGPLPFMHWNDWRERYEVQAVNAARPQHWTVRPYDEALMVGPTPDIAYLLRGPYQRTVQTLAANADVPLMPDRFHDIIMWRALQLLAEMDEAPPNYIGDVNRNYREALFALERDMLPDIWIPGSPIA